MSKKYCSKPVVIEAVQFDGTMSPDLVELFGTSVSYEVVEPGTDNAHILIPTLEGTMRGNIGDYIIKGTRGEFYPCKPDVFEFKYEPVEDMTRWENSKEQKRAIACEKILKNEPVEEYTQTAQELNAILNWRKSKNCKCGCNDEFQCCNYCFDRIPLNKIDIDCVVYHCDRKPDGSCPWLGKDGALIDK